MNKMQEMLIACGYINEVEMASFLSAIDNQFGEGNGHKKSEGKSWGDVTTDDWRGDPSMIEICEGNKEEILLAYTNMRRSGVRGWLNITTTDYQYFVMWKLKQ